MVYTSTRPTVSRSQHPAKQISPKQVEWPGFKNYNERLNHLIKKTDFYDLWVLDCKKEVLEHAYTPKSELLSIEYDVAIDYLEEKQEQYRSYKNELTHLKRAWNQNKNKLTQQEQFTSGFYWIEKLDTSLRNLHNKVDSQKSYFTELEACATAHEKLQVFYDLNNINFNLFIHHILGHYQKGCVLAEKFNQLKTILINPKFQHYRYLNYTDIILDKLDKIPSSKKASFKSRSSMMSIQAKAEYKTFLDKINEVLNWWMSAQEEVKTYVPEDEHYEHMLCFKNMMQEKACIDNFILSPSARNLIALRNCNEEMYTLPFLKGKNLKERELLDAFLKKIKPIFKEPLSLIKEIDALESMQAYLDFLRKEHYQVTEEIQKQETQYSKCHHEYLTHLNTLLLMLKNDERLVLRMFPHISVTELLDNIEGLLLHKTIIRNTNDLTRYLIEQQKGQHEYIEMILKELEKEYPKQVKEYYRSTDALKFLKGKINKLYIDKWELEIEKGNIVSTQTDYLDEIAELITCYLEDSDSASSSSEIIKLSKSFLEEYNDYTTSYEKLKPLLEELKNTLHPDPENQSDIIPTEYNLLATQGNAATQPTFWSPTPRSVVNIADRLNTLHLHA
jgi:hypothetical protein